MDKETFSTLVHEQQRQLYRIAVSYTASSADAEDAMQEALLRAWKRRDTLRNPAYFGTWLNRILINECKTLLANASGSSPPPTCPTSRLHRRTNKPWPCGRRCLHCRKSIGCRWC